MSTPGAAAIPATRARPIFPVRAGWKPGACSRHQVSRTSPGRCGSWWASPEAPRSSPIATPVRARLSLRWLCAPPATTPATTRARGTSGRVTTNCPRSGERGPEAPLDCRGLAPLRLCRLDLVAGDGGEILALARDRQPGRRGARASRDVALESRLEVRRGPHRRSEDRVLPGRRQSRGAPGALPRSCSGSGWGGAGLLPRVYPEPDSLRVEALHRQLAAELEPSLGLRFRKGQRGRKPDVGSPLDGARRVRRCRSRRVRREDAGPLVAGLGRRVREDASDREVR